MHNILFCTVQHELRTEIMDTNLTNGKHSIVEQTRTGQSEPLRADRWYRDEPEKEASSDCSGIQCNIWELAKKRSLLTHRLQVVDNMIWAMLQFHGNQFCMANAGTMGRTKYCLCSLTSWVDVFLSTMLNPMAAWAFLPEDRSQVNVHRMLKPFQVSLFLLVMIYTLSLIHI